MKEITRIHLAKVPYEIEVNAKKSLEEYIDKLNQYVGDSEVVNDIEIRTTEILAERGIKPEGVIGSSDVEAIKSQIGSPEEIVDEPVSEPLEPSERKLYRDLDQGLLGGVVSGLAAYFKLDVVLLRVLFAVLVIVTSGFALLVYVVMWLMVPSAKTSADKLRMQGKPVTIESIASMNRDVDPSQGRRGEVVRAVLLYLVGLGSLLGAVASLFTVVAATVSVFSEGLFDYYQDIPSAWYVAYGLAVLSGILLAILFGLIAYASFKRELSKKFLVAATIVIVTGLTSFGVAVGIGVFGAWQQQGYIQASIEERSINLPDGFNDLKIVTFEADAPISVEYAVADQPRMVLESIPGFEPQVEIDGTQATIVVKTEGKSTGLIQPTLKVFGPTLEEARVEGDSMYLNYTVKRQSSLIIEQADGAGSVVNGRIDNLEVVSGQDSGTHLVGASIDSVKLNLAHGSDIQLGNIGSLNIVHADVCPADSRPATVRVGHVASGELVLNDKTADLESIESPCFELVYGSEHN